MCSLLLETQTEPDVASQRKTVGLLLFVLRYDDLCAADSMTLPPLSREGDGFDLGRASEPGPVKLDGRALRLPDPFVSRAHARVARRGDVDLLEDCGSKLGTHVGADRIEAPRALADADCIEIGHSLFVYRRVDPLTAVRLAVSGSGAAHGPTRTLSPELSSISADLERVARSDQPVLLLAETGAGKEIAARFVHDKSGRKGPFVAIDCGAIPANLVEGELFGHKRGAFSGANEERAGRIRSAEGGTVFLDEINNMPAAAQASLLRVIQEREVVPVGVDRGKSVDVRWIAATNADLFSDRSGFRADLRARLAGYVARLPPLRERREDLGLLVAHLLGNAGARSASITRPAARALFLGRLAGNVRELERALATAVVLRGDGPIDVCHLSAWSAQVASEEAAQKVDADEGEGLDPLPGARARPYTRRPTRAEVEDALASAKRVQSKAALLLGVHERQLARWMDAYGIARTRRHLAKK